MEIGTIKAVHIYINNRGHVTAELEMNLKGVKYSFGGDLLFSLDRDTFDAPYLERFIFRCMQIGNVDSWDLLKSNKVLVELSEGKVLAIGSVTGDKWFNPTAEFEAMHADKESLSKTSAFR